MKQLITLLKANYRDAFKLNQIRYGKDEKIKSKQIRSLVGFAVLAVFLAFSMYGYFVGMAMAFNNIGRAELTLTVACCVACVVIVMTTVFHSKTVLVAFRDYDAVMSLPVSSYVVTLSRMIKLYTSNLLYILFVMVPAALAYATYSPVTVPMAILFIVTTLMLPLLPIAISGTVGLLIGMATVGFKRKNLASIILSFLLLGVCLCFSLFSTYIIENIADIGMRMSQAVERLYPPAVWYGEAVAGDLLKLALFALVNIVPFVLFTVAVGALFRKLNAVMTREKRVVMKRERMKVRSQFGALYKKEMTRYFASPLYVTNTAFGSILLILGGVAVIILARTTLAPHLQNPEIMRIIDIAAPFVPAMLASFSCTTSSSISMEREKLWQLKVLPVDVKTVFRAKLMVYFTIIVLPVVIVWVCLLIALPLSPLSAVLSLVTPLIYVLLTAVLGLALDLRMPKLNWQNEAEVVKQGMPAMIVVLGSMFLCFVPALVSLLLPLPWLPAAWTALLLGVALLIWGGLIRKGEKRFMAL